MDSGASSHMRKILTDYKAFDTPQKVSLGDGHVIHSLGVGNENGVQSESAKGECYVQGVVRKGSS